MPTGHIYSQYKFSGEAKSKQIQNIWFIYFAECMNTGYSAWTHIKGPFAPRTITIMMKIILKIESPHYSSNDIGT